MFQFMILLLVLYIMRWVSGILMMPTSMCGCTDITLVMSF